KLTDEWTGSYLKTSAAAAGCASSSPTSATPYTQETSRRMSITLSRKKKQAGRPDGRLPIVFPRRRRVNRAQASSRRKKPHFEVIQARRSAGWSPAPSAAADTTPASSDLS